MKEKTLGRLFVNRVEQYDDKIRFMEKRNNQWRPVTFRDLGREVREISLGLRSLGVRKGDKVCLMAGVRREWFACDWAIICAGALCVPIYPNDSTMQAAFIIEHSQAHYAVLDNAHALERVKNEPRILSLLKKIILMDPFHETTLDTLIHLDELKELGRKYDSKYPDAFERGVDSIRPEDDLTIIYTSGTTGAPKGVVTTHSNYIFMVDAADRAFPLKPDDSNLHILPPAHSYGRLEHFITHHKGLTTWISESYERLADNLKETRPTFLLGVPRVFEKAYIRITSEGRKGPAVRRAVFDWAVGVGKEISRRMQHRRKPSFLLRIQHVLARLLVFRRVNKMMGGNLRFAVVGAAPTFGDVLEFFHACGLLILEGWGLTEASTVGTVNRFDRFKFGTIGLPLPGVEMTLASDGEILMKGPNLFRCYYRDPEATAEAVDDQGWLHTGDMGNVDSDGFFTITGRKKDIIITAGGKNISPQKIEILLSGGPFINYAVVAGDRRKYLTALLTLNEVNLMKYAGENNMCCASIMELALNPVIVGLIWEWVHKVNASLSSYETIKNFRIIPETFSINGGELTPTFKVKRQSVIERYRELIDGMYND